VISIERLYALRLRLVIPMKPSVICDTTLSLGRSALGHPIQHRRPRDRSIWVVEWAYIARAADGCRRSLD
jgi:hypothetical protein